jgi:hypothetical protein
MDRTALETAFGIALKSAGFISKRIVAGGSPPVLLHKEMPER